MTSEQILLIAILLIGTILYATRRLPFEITSLLIIIGLAFTEILPLEKAFAGLASTATLTVAAMFVLSGGLVRTGALEAVTLSLSQLSAGSPRRLLLLLAIVIPLASGFVNNTPVVVMMLPVILSLSKQFKVSPSKLLIPVSYFSILGGTLTLFGTSTNILLDDLYRQAGGPGFSVFEFMPLGIIYWLVGGTAIFLFGDYFLPNHSPTTEALTQRPVGTYISEITLNKASLLLGRRVTRVFNQIANRGHHTRPNSLHGPRRRISNPSHVRNQPQPRGGEVELLSLRRDGINYVGNRTQDLSLYEGDILTVSGTPNAIAHFLSNAQAQPVFTYEDLETTAKEIPTSDTPIDTPADTPVVSTGVVGEQAVGEQTVGAQAVDEQNARNRLQVKQTHLSRSGEKKRIQGELPAKAETNANSKNDGKLNDGKLVEQQLVEGVILPESPLNNRRIDEIQTGPLHNIRIIGIQHRGKALPRGLTHRRVESGDVLLLQSTTTELHEASAVSKLLLIEGVENSILRASKNRLALLIMVAVILLAALTSTPLVVLALAGATFMVITRCLRIDEAVQSLDSSTLLLLAAAIPLGYAMDSTGLSATIVDLLLSTVGGASPVLFLSVFYLVANLLAQVISAKAVAVLFAPVALSLATQMGVNPSAMIMAIAFGTAASFLTPMGHQVNAIVMGPGNYTFGDYIRIGLPMTILMWLVATIAIPWVWPL